jgi:hypothetical protein
MRKYSGLVILVLLSLPAAASPPEFASRTQQPSYYYSITLEQLYAMIVEMDRRYEQRFNAQDKAVAAALDSAKEAVLKAEVASEKRFESINEFRGQLRDQQQTFVTRDEVAIRFRAVEDRVQRLDEMALKNQARLEGFNWLWGIAGTAFGMLVAGFTVYSAIRNAGTVK